MQKSQKKSSTTHRLCYNITYEHRELHHSQTRRGLRSNDDGNGNGISGGFLGGDITNTSELDPNLPSKLKDGGTISSGGRSGGNRPLAGPPNSYVTTSGGHAFIYDDQGRLIFDIAAHRVKMTVWDQAPNGRWFPRDVKLVGPVPPEYLRLLP